MGNQQFVSRSAEFLEILELGALDKFEGELRAISSLGIPGEDFSHIGSLMSSKALPRIPQTGALEFSQISMVPNG